MEQERDTLSPETPFQREAAHNSWGRSNSSREPGLSPGMGPGPGRAALTSSAGGRGRPPCRNSIRLGQLRCRAPPPRRELGSDPAEPPSPGVRPPSRITRREVPDKLEELACTARPPTAPPAPWTAALSPEG